MSVTSPTGAPAIAGRRQARLELWQRNARRFLADYVLGKPPQILELRGGDAHLLAEVLEQLRARGVAASDVFEAMLQQLAEADVEVDDAAE